MARGEKLRTAGKAIMANPALQQLGESLLAAGVIALPQAASGEADLDLALGVLGGLAVAAPSSIIAARGGKLIGRQIDRYMHSQPGRIDGIPFRVRKIYESAMSVPLGSRQQNHRINQMIEDGTLTPNNPMGAIAELSQARYRAEGQRPDGTVMDDYLNGMEHDLGTLGRRYGDNLGQLIAQLGIAAALNGEKETESE